jgi:hypothetical protein
LFKCAGISSNQVKKKLFTLSLKGRAEEWYRLLEEKRRWPPLSLMTRKKRSFGNIKVT